MKTQNVEGEAGQQGFDDRQQVGFADLLAGGDQLPLGDAIDGIDVINAFDAVLVALGTLSMRMKPGRQSEPPLAGSW